MIGDVATTHIGELRMIKNSERGQQQRSRDMPLPLVNLHGSLEYPPSKGILEMLPHVVQTLQPIDMWKNISMMEATFPPLRVEKQTRSFQSVNETTWR